MLGLYLLRIFPFTDQIKISFLMYFVLCPVREKMHISSVIYRFLSHFPSTFYILQNVHISTHIPIFILKEAIQVLRDQFFGREGVNKFDYEWLLFFRGGGWRRRLLWLLKQVIFQLLSKYVLRYSTERVDFFNYLFEEF